MMTVASITAFAATAAVAALSPGPAVMLSLRNGATFGLRAVAWSALGNISGLCMLSGASVLGLGVVLASSVMLFNAVKFIGAAYLVYIGIRHLIAPQTVTLSADESCGRVAQHAGVLYREGLLIAATNPKAILFCTALFPQFVDPRIAMLPQFLTLVSIYMAISYMTQLGYAMVAMRARAWLVPPTNRQRLSRGIGLIFVAIGLRMLTLRRLHA